MIQDCVKTWNLKGLRHFEFYSSNQWRSRFFCDPHRTDSFYDAWRIKSSINWCVWLIFKQHNITMNIILVDVNTKLVVLHYNRRKPNLFIVDESIISVFNIIFESVLFRFDFILFNIISFLELFYFNCKLLYFRNK